MASSQKKSGRGKLHGMKKWRREGKRRKKRNRVPWNGSGDPVRRPDLTESNLRQKIRLLHRQGGRVVAG